MKARSINDGNLLVVSDYSETSSEIPDLGHLHVHAVAVKSIHATQVIAKALLKLGKELLEIILQLNVDDGLNQVTLERLFVIKIFVIVVLIFICLLSLRSLILSLGSMIALIEVQF